MGLPSRWSNFGYYGVLVCLGLSFLLPMLMRFGNKLLRKEEGSYRPRTQYGLLTRCVALLMAAVFLIGVDSVRNLAEGAVSYSQLSTTQWAKGDTTIAYTYDNNGSLETKTSTGTETKAITYDYNLQNRLERVSTDYQNGTVEITDYTYSDNGIRVASHGWTEVNGQSQNDDVYKTYLIDPFNHTGYAQVLEETIDDGSSTLKTITYTIGDDVIAQAKTDWTLNGSDWEVDTQYETEYLLYDGHGSTRQLADGAGAITDCYSYDAYGVMLGGNPTSTSPAATNLLYSGEQFDTDLQQYYLRARYYNPSNGRFNRIDPFAGNSSDPQSLHKYIYAHNNPINSIDPTGMMEFSIGGLVSAVTTRAILISSIYIGSNTLYNVGSFATADKISKNHYEPSGRWITSMAGLAFGFGPAGGVFGVTTARGTSTGRAIVGVIGGCGLVFPISKAKAGVKYLLDHKSDLAAAIRANWNQNPLDNGHRVVNNILKGFRSFSQDIGAEFKQASIGGGLIGGNGIVMNANYAYNVVGLSVGGGGTIQGTNVGVFGETFLGLSLSSGLTGVVSVGGGMTLSFASTPTGMITVGVSVFVPTNMEDWGLGDL